MNKVIVVGWCPECGERQCVKVNVLEGGVKEVTVGCTCGRGSAETTTLMPFEGYELKLKPLFEHTPAREDEAK